VLPHVDRSYHSDDEEHERDHPSHIRHPAPMDRGPQASARKRGGTAQLARVMRYAARRVGFRSRVQAAPVISRPQPRGAGDDEAASTEPVETTNRPPSDDDVATSPGWSLVASQTEASTVTPSHPKTAVLHTANRSSSTSPSLSGRVVIDATGSARWQAPPAGRFFLAPQPDVVRRAR
jgi:hypothetical protein